MRIVRGNILDATEQYIVHQTNCVPGVMGGLAGVLRAANPAIDTRHGICRPGYIDVYSTVINLYGQRKTGHPSDSEPRWLRLKWFAKGLTKIADLEPVSLAFPWGIGCGLAGGKWEDYLDVLLRFETYYQIPVTLYKLPVDFSTTLRRERV